MEKYYLLIAGDNYYPQFETDDWVGCYETFEEALNVARTLNKDWFDIVDLRKWIRGDEKSE